jgi:hypothetical protein
MFTGPYTIHLADASSSGLEAKILRILFQEHARIAPAKLEHMMIFANKVCHVKNHCFNSWLYPWKTDLNVILEGMAWTRYSVGCVLEY